MNCQIVVEVHSDVLCNFAYFFDDAANDTHPLVVEPYKCVREGRGKVPFWDVSRLDWADLVLPDSLDARQGPLPLFKARKARLGGLEKPSIELGTALGGS